MPASKKSAASSAGTPKPRRGSRPSPKGSSRPPSPKPSSASSHAELTVRQAAFVAEYLVDLNGAKAAIRAGFSAKGASVQATRLLANAKVQAALKAAMDERAKRVAISADEVVSRLWSIATADPNELIEYRRTCCRYCYGEGFRYQRTPRQRFEALAAWTKEQLAATDDKPVLPFDELGGVGFDPRKDPRQDCPECFGQGEGDAFVRDTRQLIGSAAHLYAGVKVSKDGLEVKMHDQAAALRDVGRHLGIFKEKLELSDPNGKNPFAELMEAVAANGRPRPGS